MELFSYRDPAFIINHICDQPDKPFKMHTHNFAELFFFISGRGTFHVEGSRYPLSPGDIILMRPAEAHYIEVDPSIDYERIFLNFDVGLLDSLEPGNQLMEPFFNRKAGKQNHFAAKAEVSAYMYNMVRPDSTRATIIANLILVMQSLCRDFGTAAAPISTPDSLEYRMIRYINQNLQKDLSLQALCDHFFLSRAQLCRRFKEATGTSVGRYIAVKRLIQARELIAHGQKPTEAFTACGYKDYTTFYRAYLAYFGYSPSRNILDLPAGDLVTIE